MGPYVFEIWDLFGIKNLGEYYDLYVQTDTLLLEKFLKNIEIKALKYMDLILLISYLHLD